MTCTQHFRDWATAQQRTRKSLTALDDALLEHRKRERDLDALDVESDDNLAARYGLDNS